MKKLKIIFVDFDDIKNPLLGAGQAKATLEVGSRLAQHGHEVIVYCSKYPGYKNRKENGIKYHHIGIATPNIKLNNLIFIFSLPFVVPRLKGDILIESFAAPISTLFCPLYTRIPVVGLPSMFNAKEFSKKYHLPFYLVEKIGIKFYKYIMPYSDIDSSKAKLMNPKIDYRIIPQGVGKEFFDIKHKNPEHILFLSRLDIGQKGVDLLLKTYKKIENKIQYPLIIAGNGPDEKKIAHLIDELGLKSKVTMVGSAYGEKKFDLISRAIFVAFPSRHDELSLWSLEALASGMPLVMFDLPEARWVEKNASLKAKPFNLNEYGNLMIEATDKNKNLKMRKSARMMAKKYDWESVACQFEDYFYEIINKTNKKI